MSEGRPLRLWYQSSAPTTNDFCEQWSYKRADAPGDGWEAWSLPIGNGYLGANVFGRTETERIQITENSLENDYDGGGLNNFAELLIDLNHANPENYVRELSLDDAVTRTSYDYSGVHYVHEAFASYPDKVLVVRIAASEKGSLSLTVRPEVPFIRNTGDGYGKNGSVEAHDGTITIKGEMEFYAVRFEGQFRVIPFGGEMTTADGRVHVKNADSAVIIAAVGTNYRLESRVFTESDPKKKLSPYPDPHENVTRILSEACEKDFDTLRTRHLNDFRAMFGRVELDLGDEGFDLPTDELLKRYRAGEKLHYLESLYYQYGRYLLISSSRPGTLPANLQGTWNCYGKSPWGSGYWHNINVQMNYWPAFVANLAETFTAYADYADAYMQQAEKMADEYVAAFFPERLEESGKNGWIIGTTAYPYTITNAMEMRKGKLTIGHSGPGTGAFTSILFWEWYRFTKDSSVLKRVFPMLKGMSHFLSKTVDEVDGKLLVRYSASPEQIKDGKWSHDCEYYHTVGCAFDQQMIFENHNDLINAARELGISGDPVVKTAEAQIDRLDPVLVGASGQIKEFREENEYGEIGEKAHRHISHLVGLYPGSCINRDTPDWMDAARVTLNLRGDLSTGWAMAHRLNAWARAMDGNRAHKLYRTLLSNGTYPNLWDSHPPFQIDGNFGGTSGVSEMLLQSQAGYIDVLPSLPDDWQTGSYRGLVARGNIVVDAAWQQGRATEIALTARASGTVSVRCDRMENPAAYDIHCTLLAKSDENGFISLEMQKSDCIYLRPQAHV